ncbi:DUF5994 family protein [Streptomyces sp. NPDC005202]|uniref:DUF5994 family protein n=1 Tax=Streptomyces sp. NPDC005202 TaxID=3157021 RepID=UPI0033B075D8
MTTDDHHGILDGAWWPRSRNIAAELPGLITALTERLGPVVRIGVDSDAWDWLPTRMIIDDQVVHIDAFSVGDGTLLVTHGNEELFSLLVIPPDAPPDAAHAAMAEALRTDNRKQAEQILLDTGSEHARPAFVEGPRQSAGDP